MTNKKKAIQGRPELPEKKRKSVVVQFRCTEQEKKLIEIAAARNGLKVSDWVREKVLKSAN